MILITVSARLAFQPELKLLPNGGSVCELRLLDTRFAKGEEHVEAVTFVCFDDLAEEFCQRCEKGQLIEATGTQETHRYTPNGSQEERTVVKYRMVWFKPGPKPRNQSAEGGRPPQQQGRTDAQPRRAQPSAAPVAPRERPAGSLPPRNEDDSAKTGFF